MSVLVLQWLFRRVSLFSLSLAMCLGLFFVQGERVTATARSQRPDEQATPRILRSKTTLQTVEVQVTDKYGNSVRGLTAKDFTVREDGQRQETAFFDAGRAPVTVAVLVDSAVSMSQDSQVGSADEVAAEFARIARPGDDIYTMDFTSQPGPLEHFTASQVPNHGPLTMPSPGGDSAALYDAVAKAICGLRISKNPRQAIVVITDGIDEYSRLNLNQLINAVRAQRAQLFLIRFQSKVQWRPYDRTKPTVMLWGGHDIDNPDYVFGRLAKQAGAETLVVDSESGLQKALRAVSDTLNVEYTLAYYPPPTRRKARHIQVRVDRHGVRVLAIPTMVSNQISSDTVRYLPGTCAVSPVIYPYPFEPHISGEPGELGYRDDFSDPRSGWPIHFDSHYASGGYEISTLEQAAGRTLASGRWLAASGFSQAGGAPRYREDVIAADGTPGPSWADFRASATVRFELLLNASDGSTFSPRVRPAAGLVFRLSWRGYYALLISPASHRNEWAFELVARKFPGDLRSESVIVSWTVISILGPEAQLAVQDIGDQIRLFIGGRLAGTARDDTFGAGAVGFIVDGPGQAIFSSLVQEQK